VPIEERWSSPTSAAGGTSRPAAGLPMVVREPDVSQRTIYTQKPR
jgi:hypothetical protein